MKHILLQSLFEKGNASQLPVPFSNNSEYISGADTGKEYFDETVYRVLLSPSEQKPLGYVHQIERAITRLIIPEITEYKGYGGYGFGEDGTFYADYNDLGSQEYALLVSSGKDDFSDSGRILMKLTPEGEYSAAVTDRFGVCTPYLVRTRNFESADRHSPSAGIYFIVAYVIAKCREHMPKDHAASLLIKHFDDVVNGFRSFDMELFGDGMRAMDADIYSLINFNDRLTKEILEVMPDIKAMDTDSPGLWNLEDEPVPKMEKVYGNSPYLGSDNGNMPPRIQMMPKDSTVKAISLGKRYDLGKVLSPDEEKLVPVSLDEYVPSDDLIDTAAEIKVSTDQPRPCRNILLTGETGTGKTTGAMMIARMLHLPYYSMALSGDKLSGDLTLTCLPNPQKISFEEIADMMDRWPDSEAVFMDPAAAFMTITGKSKPDATERDVNRAKTRVLVNKINRTNDFIYVESPFVKAYRDGGVIELQEANACKPEILKSLNEALDDLNVIHLTTGEIVRRNPFCVVIATANVGDGYQGVKAFSNDFLARFDQANILSVPDDDVMTERIIKRTGYTDKKVIRKMLDVMRSIKAVLEADEGNSGACSPRSVYAWARKTANTGDPYRAALSTIVGLSTQDPEIRVDVLHALETQFTASAYPSVNGGGISI